MGEGIKTTNASKVRQKLGISGRIFHKSCFKRPTNFSLRVFGSKKEKYPKNFLLNYSWDWLPTAKVAMVMHELHSYFTIAIMNSNVNFKTTLLTTWYRYAPAIIFREIIISLKIMGNWKNSVTHLKSQVNKKTKKKMQKIFRNFCRKSFKDSKTVFVFILA